MNDPEQIEIPSGQAVMIFDGDCYFCRIWVERWRAGSGDRIFYIPSQDPRVRAWFPEISEDQFAASVFFAVPGGEMQKGAQAVFSSLAWGREWKTPIQFYKRFPRFAQFTEAGYGIVARNRTFFSRITRFFLDAEPGRYLGVRSLLLRGLGAIYFLAFLSLGLQIIGLVGSKGIIPVRSLMESPAMLKMGVSRFWYFPTLSWLNPSDWFLQFQCLFGIAAALCLIRGFQPFWCAILLWISYLSMTTAGSLFMGYQWDNLLLEAGLLAVFLAPRTRFLRESGSTSFWPLFLFRWLLFRLMFQSGLVKLLSGDRSWRDLTALQFHYETQPLPTLVGWLMHQLPATFQTTTAVILLIVELVTPFLYFGNRKQRLVGFICLVVLQFSILLTGNFGFFNWLTLVLSLSLLDDRNRLLRPLKFLQPGVTVSEKAWPRSLAVPVFLGVIFLTLTVASAQLNLSRYWIKPLRFVVEGLRPIRSFNNYGLFAVMTRQRPEIVIEGSMDGAQWLPYEFKYKPGDLGRFPGFAAPHQPRLDWQMWFAALGDFRQNPWLITLGQRLMERSPEVVKMLGKNPFPEKGPNRIRFVVYRYQFTDWSTLRSTGRWWKREIKGLYMPVLVGERSGDRPAPP